MKKSFRCVFSGVLLLVMIIFPGCAGKPAPLETQKFLADNYDNYLSLEAEELVRTGIHYHDQRDYQNALNYYTQALELAPNHPVILYEMGYSYISMGNNDAALEMADKGIEEAENRGYTEVIPSLLDLKGSALDNMGRSEEAINVYLKALNDYGVSNTFLYYNLAVSYYRIEKREDALEALAKGLAFNPNHASSNYLMGKICMEDGKSTQAFYALCYFLLLEPNTERALQSYNTILYMLKPEDTIEIGIGVRDNGAFTASDIVISTAFALDEENFRLSDAEKTKAKLYYIMTSLEDLKNSGRIQRSGGDELWWDFYSPFFNRIALSDYFDIYCKYIAISVDPDVDSWIENERNKIEAFFGWLNEYLE